MQRAACLWIRTLRTVLTLGAVLTSTSAKAQSAGSDDSSEQQADATSYLWPQVTSPVPHVNDVWRTHVTPQAVQQGLAVLAGDTLPYLPKEYAANYRNPCWHDGMQMRCLPYFQILGVSKCGTTDYYHRLTLHPDMVTCGWKGPHFWDESVYPTKKRPSPASAKPKYDGSFPAYVGVFDRAAMRIGQDPGHRITGEASSNTFTAVLSHLRGQRGRLQPNSLTRGRASASITPNITLAHYLHAATPWSRYLVLLRDPVTRYYSAFHYYRSRREGAGDAQQFDARARMDIARWQTCESSYGMMACIQAYEPQQLVKGMYAMFLPAWWAVWPKQALLIMRNEDYQSAPRQHMQAGFMFLGMRNLTEPEWVKVVGMPRANKGKASSSGSNANASTTGSNRASTASSPFTSSSSSQSSLTSRGGGLLPETVALLRDFYTPFNRRLSELMGGDSRWRWGY